MTCTIIVYSYNSLPFLKGCVRQIEKYKHPEIEQKILIGEQGSDDTFREAVRLFGSDVVYKIEPLRSGYTIDYFMRSGLVNTDYVCTLDVDAFPIHRNWLKVPITLCEEFGFRFAGVHAEIESAYGGGFFCMGQFFRVGRTKDYKMLSEGGGFIRWDYRKKTDMVFKDYGWNVGGRAWSDSAVIAHWWEDMNCPADKFAFATLEHLDHAPKEGYYGRNTDDLIFHFAFSYNSRQVADRMGAMGEKYWEWTRRIDETGFSEELLNEMLSQLKPLPNPIYRKLWHDKKITPPGDELNRRIEELKNL